MHWYMPMMEWLAQYDGLSLILGTEALSPEAELLHALNSLKPGDDLELGKLIASLDFLHWRIRLDDCERWNPLYQPLADYLTQHPDLKPAIWWWEDTYPAVTDLLAWLEAKSNLPHPQSNRHGH